jgi:PAS domain S-box-containing protein
MEKMAKMAKIGGWDYDLRTRQPFFTQETFNIFGLPGPNPPSEEEGLRFYLPQSRARVLKAFEDAVQENRPYDLEVPFHSAQGTAKWVRTMGEAYFEDGEPVKVIGAIQDITDRKLRENKLIEREQKLQTLFDYLHESILILEGDRIVECNRAFLELTEYKEKELILRSFLDLAPVHQKDGESSAEHWKKIQVNVKNQLSYQFLWEMINKAGEKIVCEITLSQIPGETGVQNIRQVSIIRDVTLRQQDEDLLRAALQEKVFLLRELYHRTKNTMQMIKGMLFLQGAKHPKIPEIQRLVKDIDGRIIAMSLVHQKLYQSKNLSEINMSEYLGELVALILEGYKREGNKIQSEINLEDLQLKVDMAIPFGLIVNELLTNTLKYAFREGETGKIWVELKQSAPGEWTFDYSDNGQGFPPGFDPIKDGDLGLKMILKIAGSQLGGHGRFIPQDGVSFRMTFRPEE